MSAEQLITDHLDLWTSAVTYKSGRGAGKGRELTGIKKLREQILELAVRGKLVEQDPNDEPASVLLEKIAEEKAWLVKEGKIRKSQGSTDKAAIENSFDTNKGWIKTTLSNIGYWAIGNGFPKQEQGQAGEEILFCKVSDMNLTDNHKEILATTSTVSYETAKRLKLNLHPAGTIIFPKIGGAISTNKRRKVVQPTAIDNNCLGVIPSCGVSSDYLFLFLTSVNMAEYQAGTSVPALSQNVLGKIVIRLPPLQEQHRIVAKVDELMALCDRLEQQTGDQLDAHEVLVDTLLDALIRAESADEVAAQWARLAEHFDTLFTTEASIDKLKQAILQLAVMGRLVEQDPNDEPASVLLEKIAEEKARLVEEGKIKKPKKLLHISELELPTFLPSAWKWVRLQDAIDVRDGTHESPKTATGPNTFPLVTSKDFKNGEIDFTTTKRISAEDYFNISQRSLVEQDDILFSMIGGNIGNQVIVKSSTPFSIKNVALFKYYDKSLTYPAFVKIYMENLARDLQVKASGGAQPFISLGKLRNLLFPLPPICQQHRIVAKVEELMALCDQLKARLSNIGETRAHLAEAVVMQAVE